MASEKRISDDAKLDLEAIEARFRPRTDIRALVAEVRRLREGAPGRAPCGRPDCTDDTSVRHAECYTHRNEVHHAAEAAEAEVERLRAALDTIRRGALNRQGATPMVECGLNWVAAACEEYLRGTERLCRGKP